LAAGTQPFRRHVKLCPESAPCGAGVDPGALPVAVPAARRVRV
jgi:hypothetical protein